MTGSFSAPGLNSWLLDDLAEEFASQGHQVDVVVHSPTAPRPRGASSDPLSGVSVFSVGTEREPRGRIHKAMSYVATGFRIHRHGWQWIKTRKYDLAIYTSIAAFSFGFPSRLRRRLIASTLLFVMWDFFPIHQYEIGRMRAELLHRPLKWVERMAIRRADAVAAMSPANAAFLTAYHPGLPARVFIVPPWASPVEDDQVPAKRDRFTVIFGGQLARGRGVETLVEAAAIVQDSDPTIEVLIAGDGPERDSLRDLARRLSLDNVSFTGALHRDEYRSLLRSCHAGVAITVPGVTPPTFPSKIVEYCANAIPVIVTVEESSDAGEIVVQEGAGLSTPAGDADSLASAILRLSREHASGILDSRSVRARKLFEQEFSTRIAVSRLTAATVRTNGSA